MIYIPKGRGRYKGVNIVRRFLLSHWDKDIHQYVNLTYDELKRSGELEEFLINEQQGVCCYCMRKLSHRHVTLEHIMPFSLPDSLLWQIDMYHRFKYLSRKRVKYVKEEDIDKYKYQSIPPTPHFIAYENIVASCDGLVYGNNGDYRNYHQTCNNVRGCDFIKPVFFNPDAVQHVKYQIDGTYICKDTDAEKMMDIVRLNDEMLKSFRIAWAAFVIEDVGLQEVLSQPDDENHRKEVTDYLSGHIDSDFRKALSVKSDYWKTFLEFEWFYGYFKKHIPKHMIHA